MTGLDLATGLVGNRVYVTNGKDQYRPRNGCVYLCSDTINGETPRDLLHAAHECRHLDQHRNHPWLFTIRWFLPITWWLEWDANRFALKAVKEIFPGQPIKWPAIWLILGGLTYF